MNRCLPALLIGLFATPLAAGERFTFHHENVLGTSLELQVDAEDRFAAERVEQAVLDEIDRLSGIFSSYDKRSEFSRWQQSQPGTSLRLSPELLSLLASCDTWKQISRGALNPGAEKLTRIWKQAAAESRLPGERELAEAVAELRRPAWLLDEETGQARRLADYPLTLNAIAKGHIIDRGCEAAREAGATAVLLNVGGDLRASGGPAREIGIANPWSDSDAAAPLVSISVENRAVATSGNYRRGLQIGGRWYSHIFDPRTGRPVDHVVSATAIAATAADADALATIFSVLPVEESLELADLLPGVECLLLTTEGDARESRGWRDFERPGSLPALAQARSLLVQARDEKQAKPSKAETWNGGLDFTVELEINRPRSSRSYRRPYVAVWIEDADGFPVRTISLWMGRDRWLPELRRWYRDERARSALYGDDLVDTVSRATRQPGKYKLAWDGKDDAGKLVKPGRYTVLIEAAREHGTYQLIRQEVAVDGKPAVHDSKGNLEIKSARVTIARRESGKNPEGNR